MGQTGNEKNKGLYTEDVIIWCAGQYGQKVSSHIQSNGGRISCFCDMDREKQGSCIKNIPVYSFEEARKRNPHALIVIAHNDYTECIRIKNKLETYGYIKNKSCFIALEMEAEGNLPLIKAPFCLTGRKIILLGPQYLCECFIEWTGGSKENILICPLMKDAGVLKQKYPTALWIPLYRGSLGMDHDEKVHSYRQYLSKENVLFTDWFLNHFDYCKKNDGAIKYCDIDTSVRKVLFNISVNNAGNTFMDGILDSHPNILYFGLEMYVWTNNIWDIIKIAKRKKGTEAANRIIEKIRDYTLDAWNKNIDAISVITLPDKDLAWLDRYRYFLCQRMREDRQYTEKELFVNMHLAWKEANHQSIAGNETVIYMDIHGSCAPWETYRMMTGWLEKMGFEVVLLQMVRRPYSQSASAMKAYIAQGNFQAETALSALTFVAYEILYKELHRYPVLRLRFEDVKQHPEAVLKKLCKRLHISWNESMLETTSAGKPTQFTCGDEVVSGYHMKPVWYPYDEFFDAFDKFRLDILCRSKCEAYDYSYVPQEKYILSANLLAELFVLPFQFEKYLVFKNAQERKQFRESVREHCRNIICGQESREKSQELFCFGPYLSYINEDDTEDLC